MGFASRVRASLAFDRALLEPFPNIYGIAAEYKLSKERRYSMAWASGSIRGRRPGHSGGENWPLTDMLNGKFDGEFLTKLQESADKTKLRCLPEFMKYVDLNHDLFKVISRSGAYHLSNISGQCTCFLHMLC